MPVVHPAELWKQTGRWFSIDQALVRFKDRGERDLVLAMTHEEVVADLARSEIRSYRQLPQLVYQIQTKFRDEPRARGGLIRVREFIMKDSYSLDRDVAGLERTYRDHYDAYFRVGARAGLPLTAVQSDVGMMGGKVAHEFMYITPIGEDSLAICGACGYSANREVAEFRRTVHEAEPPRALEKVATPNTETIESLAAFLNIDSRATAKVVFFIASFADDRPDRLVMAVVRGDMDVNAVQVQNLIQGNALRPAHPEEIYAVGAVPGYGSPIGINRGAATVVVDTLVVDTPNLVSGANESGYHLLNVNVPRDFQPDFVGSIASVHEGAPCTRCGHPLHMVRGVEVGNIFQLGTRYTAALNATFTDEDGTEHPIIMGSYGIGVGRLLACVAEEHRDERGLALPISVAPFEVALLSLGRSEAALADAETLYAELTRAGISVLYDDRSASAGVKFADADLRGIPLRLTISDRSLAAGGVECRPRRGGEAQIVPLSEIVTVLQGEIDKLWQELNASVQSVPTWDTIEARGEEV